MLHAAQWNFYQNIQTFYHDPWNGAKLNNSAQNPCIETYLKICHIEKFNVNNYTRDGFVSFLDFRHRFDYLYFVDFHHYLQAVVGNIADLWIILNDFYLQTTIIPHDHYSVATQMNGFGLP